MRNIKFYIPGIFLVLMGIAVIIVPEILIAIVAATIIMSGFAALQVGYMIHKSQNDFNNFKVSFFDDFYFTRPFVFDKWQRWL